MSNVQVTIRANGQGIDPAWRTIRSEYEGDVASREILSNEISRRLATRPGTYFTRPEYGLCVEDLLGSAATSSSIDRLSMAIEAQVSDDERVLSSSCSIVAVNMSGAEVKLKMKLVITPRLGEQFALTLAVSGVTLSVLKGG